MNPFLKTEFGKLNVIKVHSTTNVINVRDVPEDGIIVGKYRTEINSYIMEQQERTSVYRVPYIINVLFKHLSSAGRDLLLYIIYKLPKEQDWINLKYDKVLKEMDVSRSTLSRAIQNLVDNAYIIKKAQSDYWINPTLLYKGNRLSYYNDNCPECIEVVAEISKNE